jgi:tyrosine-protein phosphatase YwqE
VKESYHSQKQSEKQIDVPTERVTVVRSGHGRVDGTYTTSASFIINASGVKLLAGRHITKRSASALERNALAFEASQPHAPLPFTARSRPTTPKNTEGRKAA